MHVRLGAEGIEDLLALAVVQIVPNKAADVVIGVDVDGIKQVLGIWIQQTEGAKFWHGVLTELRNRGCRDALFVCCATA